MKYLLLLVASATIASLLYLTDFKTEVAQSEVTDIAEEIIPPMDTSRDHEGDTFSIVAYDPATGEIGGAGTSCFSGNINFLNDIIRDSNGRLLGAIHTQAAYDATNQSRARARMIAGDTPQQIINSVVAQDGNPNSRQYGVVGISSTNVIRTAGYTGTTNGDWKGHRTGATYSIQGNILDNSTGGAGQMDLLIDMENAFNNTQGTLADKLMAALQGAKRVGGDSRCAGTGNSGKASFIRVLRPQDNINSPYIDLWVYPNISLVEPIDLLQCSYDTAVNTPFCRQTVNIYPYAMDFETQAWEQEETCNVRNAWIRSRFTSPTANTGPTLANQGALYMFVESSDLGPDNFNTRSVIGSPCFVIPYNSTATFTFDYHMFGTDMGTLKVTGNDGTGWVDLWTKTGNQGNTWFDDETIDLTQFHGKTVKLRFDATTGNGGLSDMAIDDIKLTVTPGITCNTTNTFNGTWSLGTNPKIRTSAVINANYSTATSGSIDACTITVNAGRTLTIGASDYATISNNIIVNGTLIVENEGSLVQINNNATVTKTGQIIVRKTTPNLAARAFMIMGSPMSAETRAGVYATAIQVRNHVTTNFIPNAAVTTEFPGVVNFADDNGNNWLNHTGVLNPGAGYLVLPQTTPFGSGSFALEYTLGVPNNGQINFPIVYQTSQFRSPNMLSNPYASAIDTKKFLDQNSMINEVYFWEHLTAPSITYPGYNSDNYSMGDISMRNSLGGLKAANDLVGTTLPTTFMASGQGFGVMPTAGGTAIFKNEMRVKNNNNTLRQSEIEADKLWIDISNERYQLGGATLVGFTQDATDGFDTKYDAKRLATPVSLFSHLETGEQLAIQGRGIFNEDQKIALGFSTQIDANETYKISLNNVVGENISGSDVYLFDTVENRTVILSQEDYVFTSRKGSFMFRFILTFKTPEILDVQNNVVKEVIVYPNPVENTLNIQAPQQNITAVEVYDVQGKKIMSKKFDASRTQSFDVSTFTKGIYFVKVYTPEGTLVKRIIKE